MSHEVVVIQSRNRSMALGSCPSSNFTISLPHKYAKVVQIQLLSVEIPFTFFNINSTNGTSGSITFVGSVNGTTTAEIFTLPDGNYSIDDFVSALFTFLQVFTTASVPYVSNVDYDSSNRIFIQSVLPIYIYNTPNSGSLASIAGINPTLNGLPASATTPASPTLAACNITSVLANGIYTHYFDYPANFNIVNNIIMKLGNIPSNVFISSATQGTFRIQNTSSFGNLIELNTATNVGNVYNFTSPTAIDHLDVSLLDLQGNLLNLNNSEFSFSLGFTFS